jgi:hypothetical protein
VGGGCLRIIRWGLAAQVDQIRREHESIAIGMKRLATGPQQHRDALEVEQQGELAGRIVPLAAVIVLDPRGQRREGLDLDLVRPPA